VGAADARAHFAHGLVRRRDWQTGGAMRVGDGSQVQVKGGGTVAIPEPSSADTASMSQSRKYVAKTSTNG
jgi:hypothetical protein